MAVAWFFCDVMTLLGSLVRVLTASGVKFSEKFDEVLGFFRRQPDGKAVTASRSVKTPKL